MRVVESEWRVSGRESQRDVVFRANGREPPPDNKQNKSRWMRAASSKAPPNWLARASLRPAETARPIALMNNFFVFFFFFFFFFFFDNFFPSSVASLLAKGLVGVSENAPGISLATLPKSAHIHSSTRHSQWSIWSNLQTGHSESLSGAPPPVPWRLPRPSFALTQTGRNPPRNPPCPFCTPSAPTPSSSRSP